MMKKEGKQREKLKLKQKEENMEHKTKSHTKQM